MVLVHGDTSKTFVTALACFYLQIPVGHQRCGAIIRYRDDWSHEPNFCKNCKEKFAEERAAKEAAKKEREAKWQEKPCKSCGTMIRYNVDWTNPPNYCADCKERFKAEQEYKLRYNPEKGKNDFLFGTNNPRKGDGHGHVVIDDQGNVHYVRDKYDPRDKDDRNDAVAFDDHFYV